MGKEDFLIIGSDELELNKPVPWPVFDNLDNLLFAEGTVLTGELALMALKSRGLYRKVEPLPPVSAEVDESDHRACDPAGIFNTVEELTRTLDQCFKSYVSNVNYNFVPTIREIGQKIFSLCEVYPDIVLAALQLNHFGSSNSGQSVHTAVISNLLLKKKQATPEQRLATVCGGLSRETGMLEILPLLNSQNSPLTDHQRDCIRQHPARGVSILSGFGVQERDWLDAVRHHHEHLDGSGYPSGLKGAEISLAGRVIAIADTYTAMIKPRAYRDAMLAHNALKEIFVSRGEQVDNELTRLFIKEIGIFPPGAVMRLANGEIAVVTYRGENASVPLVWSVIGPRGLPLNRPVRRDIANKQYAIRNMVSAEHYLKAIMSQVQVLWR